MLFEAKGESAIEDKETAANFIKNIEIPVSLNLGLCHLKTEQYHHGIYFCSKVLDLLENFSSDSETLERVYKGTLEKAYYRRGMNYLRMGDLIKAKTDLIRANDIC